MLYSLLIIYRPSYLNATECALPPSFSIFKNKREYESKAKIVLYLRIYCIRQFQFSLRIIMKIEYDV